MNTARSLKRGDIGADGETPHSLGCGIVLAANGLRCQDYLNIMKDSVVAPSINLITLPDE